MRKTCHPPKPHKWSQQGKIDNHHCRRRRQRDDDAHAVIGDAIDMSGGTVGESARPTRTIDALLRVWWRMRFALTSATERPHGHAAMPDVWMFPCRSTELKSFYGSSNFIDKICGFFSWNLYTFPKTILFENFLGKTPAISIKNSSRISSRKFVDFRNNKWIAL